MSFACLIFQSGDFFPSLKEGKCLSAFEGLVGQLDSYVSSCLQKFIKCLIVHSHVWPSVCSCWASPPPRQLPSHLCLILWIFIYRDADFTSPPHSKVCRDPFSFVGRGSHFSVKFKRNLMFKWCGFAEEWIWSHTPICFLLLFCLRLFHFLRWCSERSSKWGFLMSNFSWFCVWKYWCCTGNSNIKESCWFSVLQVVFNKFGTGDFTSCAYSILCHIPLSISYIQIFHFST